MDPLASVLRSLRLHSAMLWRAHLTGRWGVQTNGLPGGAMVFHGIIAGRAFLKRTEDGRSFELEPGDVAIVTLADAHTMTSELDGHALPILSLPVKEGRLPILEHGTRGELTRILCGSFLLDHPARSSVLDLLPRVLRASPGAASKRTWALATLQLLEEEVERDGETARTTSLADSLLTHILSEAAALEDSPPSGLLAAAKDEQIGRALALVHADPAEDWTAEKLAVKVGMSRTRFFDRFSELVGEPPARYIARWRVHAAADLLRRGALTMSMTEIAEKVGYSSEDALSRAFKRHIGIAPGEYRRTAVRAH